MKNVCIFFLKGGTIDITAHHLMENCNVKEIIGATGGDWGGTRVDKEYIDFIKCLIGKPATNDINNYSPNVFFEACKEFESAKRTINPDIMFNARIPLEIRETFKRTHSGKDLKSVDFVTTQHKKQIQISFTGDKLRLASSDAKRFFAKSVHQIIEHLKNCFNKKTEEGFQPFFLSVGMPSLQPLLKETGHHFHK